MILNDDVGESVAVFFLLNEIPQMQRRKKKRNIHILSPDIHGLFVVMFDSCHYQFGDHAKYIHRRWTFVQTNCFEHVLLDLGSKN